MNTHLQLKIQLC